MSNRNKLLFAFLFWLLPVHLILAQENAIVVNDDLYTISLKAGIEEMEKQWGYIDDSIDGERIRTDYKNIIVQRDRFITGDLPSVLGNSRIQYLNHDQLIERFKKLKKEFSSLVIQPAEIEGARVKVTVTVYWISYKKGMLQFDLSDWSTAYFRFDCEKRKFVLEKVELGGI